MKFFIKTLFLLSMLTSAISAYASETSENFIIKNEKSLELREAIANGTNTISIKSPATLTSSFTLTLPTTAGTNGFVLNTDGNGSLGWVSAGTNTYVESGSLNSATSIVTLTKSDASTLTFDLSDFNTGTETYASSMTFATATNIVTIDMIGTDDVTVDLSYLNNTGTSVVSGSLNSATSIVTLTKVMLQLLLLI
jgi:hypothetical protein